MIRFGGRPPLLRVGVVYELELKLELELELALALSDDADSRARFARRSRFATARRLSVILDGAMGGE